MSQTSSGSGNWPPRDQTDPAPVDEVRLEPELFKPLPNPYVLQGWPPRQPPQPPLPPPGEKPDRPPLESFKPPCRSGLTLLLGIVSFICLMSLTIGPYFMGFTTLAARSCLLIVVLSFYPARRGFRDLKGIWSGQVDDSNEDAVIVGFFCGLIAFLPSFVVSVVLVGIFVVYTVMQMLSHWGIGVS